MGKPVSEYGVKGKVLGSMKSDSTDEVYTISQTEKGGLACTCVGYATSQKRPRMCKHTRRWQLNELLEQMLYDTGDMTGNEVIERTVKQIEKLFKKEV